MNILITSASKKVSLVKSFQEALAKDENGKVIAVDSNPMSPALYFADDYYITPMTTEPNYLDFMLNLCMKKDIKLLVPTRDEELFFFSQNVNEFNAINTKVLVAKNKIISICQDKKKFADFCSRNGFNVPTTWTKELLPEELEFPLFAKPRFGKAGEDTAVIESEEELAIILSKKPDLIIQSYIDAPEYTIDLFADFQGKVISVVPRQRIKVIGGESYISRTTNNTLLIGEAYKLARSLNLIGHNTIQCFLKEKEVIFIEINPRFGGAANLGFAAGVPTPSFLVRLLNGENLEPQIGDFIDGYVMLRYATDLFMHNDDLVKGGIF